MDGCHSWKKRVALYFYGELDPAGAREVESHLNGCPQCRSALAGYRRMADMLAHAPKLAAPPGLLLQLRKDVAAKLHDRTQSGRPRRKSVFGFLHPSPVFQAGFAALLLFLGFLLGRQHPLPAVSPRKPAAGELALSGNSGAIEMTPYLAVVEKVQSSAAPGTVEIYYHTLNEVRLQGNLQTPGVQELLQYALADQENPAVRLHAVKALGRLGAAGGDLDRELVQALARLLDQDQNLGVRLQALEIMQFLPPNQTLRDKLIELLLREQNTAVRIAAFRALMQGDSLAVDEVTLLRSMKQDSSNYVRYRLAKMLEKHTAGGQWKQPDENAKFEDQQ